VPLVGATRRSAKPPARALDSRRGAASGAPETVAAYGAIDELVAVAAVQIA
jgi:hypothetical protein